MSNTLKPAPQRHQFDSPFDFYAAKKAWQKETGTTSAYDKQPESKPFKEAPNKPSRYDFDTWAGYTEALGQWRKGTLKPTPTPTPTPSPDTELKPGGDQTPAPRPPRADVTPIAGNVEDAYSLFENDYSGKGFNTGQLSSEGFVDWSDKDTWDLASKYSDGLNLGAGYGKVSDNFSNLDEFSNYDENKIAAFTTDAPQIGKPAATGGLAGLRVDEKEAGVVYASGAYWMDGADGKLEKIMDPDKAGWTANRAQALEIARNRLNTGGETGESVPETAPTTTQTPPSTKQTPSSTKQTPSSPLGELPTDFGGIKLPGGFRQMVDKANDMGEDLAGEIGRSYGEMKGREKVGNLPGLGHVFGKIGGNRGEKRGRELYGDTFGQLSDFIQQ